MKTAHRQASHHKRRWHADPLSMFRAIGRVQTFTPEEQDKLNLPVILAVDNIAHGRGTRDDFKDLMEAVMVAMICAESIDPHVEKTCVDARDALKRMGDRHKVRGTWGFDGLGYQQVREAVDVYRQLTGLLTSGQLEEAILEFDRRIRDGEVLEAA